VASSPQDPDPLHPVLQEVEAELARRLDEACEAEERGIATASTEEIRHLEDALLAAAVAAGQTVSLRQRLAESTPKAPCAVEGTSTGTLREFNDRDGRAWRAWPVIPGQSQTARGKRFLGEFQGGWICFERIGDSARRRLAGQLERWTELDERDLDLLLQQAMKVRERKPLLPDSSPRPPDR
jgi:hypothetical protein